MLRWVYGYAVQLVLSDNNGCDYLFRVDNIDYHPVNLPDAFREDRLNVLVAYSETDEKFICESAIDIYNVEIIDTVRND